MKHNFGTFCYAAVLGLTCALLLTAADHVTGPYKKANAEAERIVNILKVLEISVPQSAKSEDVIKIFNDSVRQVEIGLITAYMATSEQGGGLAALHFEGQGLWGAIKGFLALDSDFKTIHAITIYQQEETPGLGGEIAADWFQDRFRGKLIVDVANVPGIRFRQVSEQLAQNEIHAITGATMTCDKLEKTLNDLIVKIEREKNK